MTMLGFSLASGISLLLLATVYMLFLHNTTHFVFNRVCVLSILVLSLIIPFVSLPAHVVTIDSPIEIGELTFTSVTVVEPATRTSLDILRIVGVIYLAGVAIMVLRIIANLTFILYLMKISRVQEIAGKKVRVHNRPNLTPMSWGGKIFIEESLLTVDRDEMELILAHESAHRNECHWLDLLLSNIVLAINWYNPAAWIMQYELIAVHEYEADRIASGLSGDKMQYQLLLIKRAAGSRFHAIADSLNHSSLKNV